jgi:hypothetical protein
VFQEERVLFWEVIVSVILRKKVYMNMCPIPNDEVINPIKLSDTVPHALTLKTPIF